MYRIVTGIDKLEKVNTMKMDLGQRTRKHKCQFHKLDRATTKEKRKIHCITFWGSK